MDAIKALFGRVSRTRVWRVLTRYLDARGNLLAGGVSYFSFFSLFPAVALGFTVFGLVLRDRPDLLAEIQDAIEQQLPGFVQTPQNPDGLIPLSIPSGTTLSVTALVGVIGLLWSGLGWLGALRGGIRSIFGVAGAPGNVVIAKVRDLAVLCTLGVGIVLVAVVNGVTSATAERVAEWVGLGGQAWVVTSVALVASFLANALLVALMLRVLSGVPVSWAAVRRGALFGGVALTLLQTFGTRLIAATTGNRLFAPVALVIGLLAFLNLIARAMLLSAAFAADDNDQLQLALRTISDGEQAKLVEGPPTPAEALGDASSPTSLLPGDLAARSAAGLPTFDRRAADRVSLASGAVLGASVGALTALGLRAARVWRRR